jgi:hypothetical protein
MLPDFLFFLDGFSGGGAEPTLARVLGHHYMRLPGAVSELMVEERYQVIFSIIWIKASCKLIYECSSFPCFLLILSLIDSLSRVNSVFQLL